MIPLTDKYADSLKSLSLSTWCSQSCCRLTATVTPDNQPTSCTVDPPNIISDHSLIVCNFSSIQVAAHNIHSTTRQWKKINRAAFNGELASTLPTNAHELRKIPTEELFEQYNSILRRLADNFARSAQLSAGSNVSVLGSIGTAIVHVV